MDTPVQVHAERTLVAADKPAECHVRSLMFPIHGDDGCGGGEVA